MATVITTVAGLKAINSGLSGDYELGANIDLVGETNWAPLGPSRSLVDSGTTDGTSSGKLIQSGQNFLTTVSVGDTVINTTDETRALVTNVDSNTQLSIDSNIMVSGENFNIYSPASGFTGTFDGKGFTISNLALDAIDGEGNGLFGKITGATIQNVTLSNFTHAITINSSVDEMLLFTGSLLGQMAGTGNILSSITVTNFVSTITYSSTTVELRGYGGMVGMIQGCTISDCTSSGSITISGAGTEDILSIGGLIGEMQGACTISDCSSSLNLDLDGNDNNLNGVGGFIGGCWGDSLSSQGPQVVNSGSISITDCSCSNTVDVNGYTQEFVGGFMGILIIGTSTSTLTRCSFSGTLNITTSDYDILNSGGLLGNYSFETGSGANQLIDCFVTGSLTFITPENTTYNTSDVGGVVGKLVMQDGGLVSGCYFTGTFNGTGGDLLRFGSVIGEFSSSSNIDYQVTNCYSTGTLTFTYISATDVGGLVGNFGSFGETNTFHKCYFNGSMTFTIGVDDANRIGGLVGTLTMSSNDTSSVFNCYTEGTLSITGISGTDINSIGGMFGQLNILGDNIVKNCYSNLAITLTGVDAFGFGKIGGFGGDINHTGSIPATTEGIFNCFNVGLITISGGIATPTEVGGFAGNLSGAGVRNLSWWTGSWSQPMGDLSDTFASSGRGTDESDADNFKNNKTHTVFAQGTGDLLPWDFTVWALECDDYPSFVGSFCSGKGIDGTSTVSDGEGGTKAAFCPYVQVGEVRKMVNSVSGLDHLEGETIKVQMDGVLPTDSNGKLTTNAFVVASGVITLPKRAAVVHAGLGYDGTVRLLKSSDGSQLGSGQTKMRRVYLAVVRMFKSLGLKVGPDEDNLSPIFDGVPSVPLFTGDKRKLPVAPWDDETEMVFKMEDPLPCHILSILLESEVEEKG